MTQLISVCPSCKGNLTISSLQCSCCGMELKKEFELSSFDKLDSEQYLLLISFLKNRGNLKEVQSELKLSYPTVKKRLDDLLISLGLNEPLSKETEKEIDMSRLKIDYSSDVRIHYVYKEAGTAPNIVPDKAAVWYYVRAFSRPAIEDTYARLVKVAEGAAHMTETELEIEFLGGCYNTIPNETLAAAAHECLEAIGPNQWTEEEQAFAKAMNEQSPMYEMFKNAGKLDASAIDDQIHPISRAYGYGSTDVGDVMNIVPTAFIGTATYNLAAPGHSWQITSCAGMSIGHKGMLLGAKALAAVGMEVVENPELLKKAKEEFDERVKGNPYKCPIPKEIPIPQPQK